MLCTMRRTLLVACVALTAMLAVALWTIATLSSSLPSSGLLSGGMSSGGLSSSGASSGRRRPHYTHAHGDADAAAADWVHTLPDWVTAQVLHTKLFSSSSRGGTASTIRPYFVRADDETVACMMWQGRPPTFSVATFVTPSRIGQLAALCEHWGGPISVALAVENASVLADPAFLHGIRTQMRDISADAPTPCALDMHLVVSKAGEREFNMWRNVARLYARTAHFVFLDVDFAPSRDLRSYLETNADALVPLLESGVLVVPAFEASKGSPRLPIPATKAELLERVRAGHAEMFHSHWVYGQVYTNHSQWTRATELYTISLFSWRYEPYAVGGPRLPWCDERFIGYGSNKCACSNEWWAAGFTFWVLPTTFAYHQAHGNEAGPSRMNETEMNLYTHLGFLRELEVKYRRPSPICHAMHLVPVDALTGEAPPQCLNDNATAVAKSWTKP